MSRALQSMATAVVLVHRGDAEKLTRAKAQIGAVRDAVNEDAAAALVILADAEADARSADRISQTPPH